MAYTYMVDLTKINFDRMTNKQNRYIVIHYTGNPTDSAKGNANYFRTEHKRSSANLFVDDNFVVQVVDNGNAAWHCGVDYSGGTAPFWNKCKNTNSIGIEMCSVNSAISEATFNNTVILVKNLMKQYGIPASNVIRHYDVCGKQCPGWTGWGTRVGDNGSIWARFKQTIQQPEENPYNKAPYEIAGESNTVYGFTFNSDAVVHVAPNENSDKVVTIAKGSKQGINQITKDGWGHIANNAGWVLLKGKTTPINNTSYVLVKDKANVRELGKKESSVVTELTKGSKQGICFINNNEFGLISNFAGWVYMGHFETVVKESVKPKENPYNKDRYVVAGISSKMYSFKVNADTVVYVAPNTKADKVTTIKKGSKQGINIITKDGWGHLANNAGWILLKGKTTPMNNTSYQLKKDKKAYVRELGNGDAKIITTLTNRSKQGICFINDDKFGLISNFAGWVYIGHFEKI